MRFKKGSQLPGAGRTRAGHHHGSHTPTSPEAVLLGKMAYHPKHFCPECKLNFGGFFGEYLNEKLFHILHMLCFLEFFQLLR